MTTPKGGDTRTTTQTTALPEWMTSAQQNLISTGQNLTSPFTGTAPTNPVAGFNADQTAAMDAARGMIGSNPIGTSSVSMQHILPALASGAQASTSQVSPEAIASFMNPYTDQVINPALAGVRREGANRDAGIGARYAAGSSFGGSGEALARGQNARATGETGANLEGTLRAQGYDKATATALANAQMRQQTELANAQMAQQSSQYNTGATNDMSKTNAAGWLDAAKSNASLGLDTSKANATFDLAALANLFQSGGLQQAQEQKVTDIPYTMLDRQKGYLNLGNVGGTQTSVAPNTAPSPLQSILGLAGTVGGAMLGGPMGASIGSSLFGGLGGSSSAGFQDGAQYGPVSVGGRPLGSW